MNQLIRCKTCDEIFMKTPFDQHPEFEFVSDRSIDDLQSVEKDDFQEFLTHHRGHQLENLKIIEESFVSEKAYSEPVKTSFFRATNGKEKFVVKKFRERIDEPLKYTLIPGDYSLKCVAIEVQSEEIAKQLKKELKPSPSQSKIDSFIKLYCAVVEDVDIDDLERIPEESDHPLKVYYRLDDVHLMYLLRNCHNLFKGPDYSAMQDFIHRHKDDGVLLLKATYQIKLSEITKPLQKGVPTALPSEKALEKK